MKHYCGVYKQNTTVNSVRVDDLTAEWAIMTPILKAIFRKEISQFSR